MGTRIVDIINRHVLTLVSRPLEYLSVPPTAIVHGNIAARTDENFSISCVEVVDGSHVERFESAEGPGIVAADESARWVVAVDDGACKVEADDREFVDDWGEKLIASERKCYVVPPVPL